MLLGRGLCGGFIMSELKTLKELEKETYTKELDQNKVINSTLLRQEAIKWMKHILTDNKFGIAKQLHLSKEEYFMCEASVKEWIKYFFNISEGDLK